MYCVGGSHFAPFYVLLVLMGGLGAAKIFKIVLINLRLKQAVSCENLPNCPRFCRLNVSALWVGIIPDC